MYALETKGASASLAAQMLDAANYSFDERSLLHFGAAALIAATAAAVLIRERASRMSLLFVLFSLLMVIWAAGHGLQTMLSDPDLIVLMARNRFGLAALVISALYQFVVAVLHLAAERRSFVRLNWMLGLLLAMGSVGTPWLIAGTRTMPWGLEPAYGPLGPALVWWAACLIVAVSWDLYQTHRRTLPASAERKRITLFSLAVACLYLTIVDLLVPAGVPVYPFGSLSALGFTLLTGYVTLRFGLVEVTAQLAASELAALARGALLILDRDGVIRVVNERSEGTLGHTREQMLGRVAGDLLGEAFTTQNLASLARVEPTDAEKDVLYRHPRSFQMRDLALSVVAVRDRQQREIAFVCMLRDITEQKRAEQERLREGLKDPLTGLPNRAMFLGLLDAAVQRTGESREYDYAVCFLGVDRMRVINEDLGNATGDRVLFELGARLRRAVRPQDAVARLGGDEFGVLLRGQTRGVEVRRLVEQIRQAVKMPLSLSDHSLYLSASIGVATSDQVHADGADLLRSAGIALHRAKQPEGGGEHYVASGESGSQRTRLEADLHRALAEGEFILHYQPVIDLTSRRIVGAEALMRWRHPRRGLLLPGEFLEFAEQIGLMRELGRMALTTAGADLMEFKRLAGKRRFTLSVNLSEDELRDETLVERVQDLLRLHQLDAAGLAIELLERVAQVEPLRPTLQRLRELGVGLFIDDFGTGYSALSRLHEAPVSALKIDRDFVRAMSHGDGGAKVIASIIALARSLDLEVVAEGCSMAEEVARLHHLGCRYVQGFYFSQGIPFEELARLLDEPQPLRDKFAGLEGLMARPVTLAASG